MVVFAAQVVVGALLAYNLQGSPRRIFPYFILFQPTRRNFLLLRKSKKNSRIKSLVGPQSLKRVWRK